MVSADLDVIFDVVKGHFEVSLASFTYGGQVDGVCGKLIYPGLKGIIANHDNFGPGTCQKISPSQPNLPPEPSLLAEKWATESCPTITRPTDLPHTISCLNEENQVCDQLKDDAFAKVIESHSDCVLI